MTALTDNEILDIQLRNRGNRDVEKLLEETIAQGAALNRISEAASSARIIHTREELYAIIREIRDFLTTVA